MPKNVVDFPVFDADNHMYETTEAFTKFLPSEYYGADQVRAGERPRPRSRSGTSSPTTSRTPPSRWWPGREPGRSTSSEAIPTGSPRREMMGEPIRSPEAFFAPEPRLALMDELGIDRALMWPTLASLLEERLRTDPKATHVVVHALNQWMHEHWSFNYEGRIFPTPVITLPIVSEAIKELEWVAERGAKIILIRPAPVPGYEGVGLLPCPNSTHSGRRS